MSDEKDKDDFKAVRAEAAVLKRTKQWDKSIKRYTKAMELTPNERNCLVARAGCFLAVGNPQRALLDAENSLSADKTYHRGIFQKAEAMFYKGEFEQALVYYHRGNKLRPDLFEFQMGIQKAKDAIISAIGGPDKVTLTTKGDLSFFKDMVEKKRQVGLLMRIMGSQKTDVKRDTNRSAMQEKTIRAMLGELYGDKIFLEKLFNETDENEKPLYDLIEEGLSQLDQKFEFWRQQRPMYARLYEKDVFRKRFSRRQVVSDDVILTHLETIDEDLKVGRYKEALQKGWNCLKMLDNFTEAQLNCKQALRAQLHNLIGTSYLELCQFEKAQTHFFEDFSIGERCMLLEAESRGLDSLGRCYARMASYEKAIKVWEKKLPLVSHNKKEVAWLQHEIGRCYLETERGEKARKYGLQCVQTAMEACDSLWQLHGHVLIGQAQIKIGDNHAAVNSFQHALKLAKELSDESATKAIRKSIDEVNSIIEAEEAKKEKQNIEAIMRG